jgi:hypothetical protein
LCFESHSLRIFLDPLGSTMVGLSWGFSSTSFSRMFTVGVGFILQDPSRSGFFFFQQLQSFIQGQLADAASFKLHDV